MANALIGDYNASGFSISELDTCVNKDLRPGFEGHPTVTVSWDLHPASGMLIACIVCYDAVFGWMGGWVSLYISKTYIQLLSTSV